MKKVFLILLLVLFNMNSFCKNLDVFLNFSLYLSEPLFFSREIIIEHLHNCQKCPVICSMEFGFETFNSILWGNTNRLSVDWKFYFLLFNDVLIKTGPGISYVNSFGTQGIAPDIILDIYYKILFVDSKLSIFQDGFFNKNVSGIRFNLMNFIIKMAFCNILVSDYKSYYFIPGINLGAGYEF